MFKSENIICKECDTTFPANAFKCPACGVQNYPNVSLALLVKPKAALEKRYLAALTN